MTTETFEFNMLTSFIVGDDGFQNSYEINDYSLDAYYYMREYKYDGSDTHVVQIEVICGDDIVICKEYKFSYTNEWDLERLICEGEYDSLMESLEFKSLWNFVYGEPIQNPETFAYDVK